MDILLRDNEEQLDAVPDGARLAEDDNAGTTEPHDVLLGRVFADDISREPGRGGVRRVEGRHQAAPGGVGGASRVARGGADGGVPGVLRVGRLRACDASRACGRRLRVPAGPFAAGVGPPADDGRRREQRVDGVAGGPRVLTEARPLALCRRASQQEENVRHVVDDDDLVCAAGDLDSVARLDVTNHVPGDDVKSGALRTEQRDEARGDEAVDGSGDRREARDGLADVERDVLCVDVAQLGVGAAPAATKRRLERVDEMMCSAVTAVFFWIPRVLFCA